MSARNSISSIVGAPIRPEVLLLVHPEAIAAAPDAAIRACREMMETWSGPLFALDDVHDHGALGVEAESFLDAVDAAVYDHADRKLRGRVHADVRRGLTRDAVRLVMRLAPSTASFRIVTVDETGQGAEVARLLRASGRNVAMSPAGQPEKVRADRAAA